MPEITRRVRIGKTLTFSVDERVFSKLKNIFVIITGGVSLINRRFGWFLKSL